jgi:hypothetical protein
MGYNGSPVYLCFFILSKFRLGVAGLILNVGPSGVCIIILFCAKSALSFSICSFISRFYFSVSPSVRLLYCCDGNGLRDLSLITLFCGGKLLLLLSLKVLLRVSCSLYEDCHIKLLPIFVLMLR